MELTKYQHACFTVEQDGKMIIIDPGNFTHDLKTPENVIGIIATHKHPDHFDSDAVKAIFAHNPTATLFAVSSVTAELDGDEYHTQTVQAGDNVTVGPFELAFYGGKHAPMFPSENVDANVGVFINKKIYFPGDSFVQPDVAVDVLALPISAPWLKLHEVIDYLNQVKPRLAFPTHDAILSETGQSMIDGMVSSSQKTGEYQRLNEPLKL